MEKKLSVNNLSISFRTPAGKVQAVRNINFDLNEGETLCIVGESGSGKSVTSRAILGILAPNAIKENGEILYNGQDLMKISEDDFHKIRGDKIAMIFQDPMSSLNPIVKVGKQLTEAMILKGKANQRNSKRTLDAYLKNLSAEMKASAEGESDENTIDKLIETYTKFEYDGIDIQSKYNVASIAANELIEVINDVLFEIEKSALKNLPARIKDIENLSSKAMHKDVVTDPAMHTNVKALAAQAKVCARKKGEYESLNEYLVAIRDLCVNGLKKVPLSPFAAAYYYLSTENAPLPELPTVEETNAWLEKNLDEKFLNNFSENVSYALKLSAYESNEKKKNVIRLLEEEKSLFTEGELDKATVMPKAKELIDAVNDSIDRLAIVKDSAAYTFEDAFTTALNQYFGGVERNAREEIRFKSQTAKYEKLVAKGKDPQWKVVPLNLTNLQVVLDDIESIFDRLIASYKASVASIDSTDWAVATDNFLEFINKNASGVVHKVTQRMAKARALKLMDEVGIPESRKRYNQYPFEFSGGMRQRIVIAIALSADPDILICDEPTTALDVTIQSQILELINKIKAERKLSVIFITHDLGVVANMADRVAVMYAGKIVELGTANDIFYAPAHPYTWALLSSMPDLDTKEKLEAIPGTPPNMIYPPVGDAFAARNKYAMAIDFKAQPPMFEISETHSAATWLLHPDAPKIDPPKAVRDRIERMKNR